MKTLLLVLLFSVLAHAKPLAKYKASDDPHPDADLSIPQSQVHFEHYAVPEHEKTVRNIEISLSSWSPKDFAPSTGQIAAADSFRTTGATISANLWINTWTLNKVIVSPKFGFEFAQLSRTGSLNLLGHNDSVHQSMNLYALRAGVEVIPAADFIDHVQPFVDLSVLPAWQQIERSDFGNSENRTAFAIEENAGVAWRSPKVASGIDARNLGFEVGVQGTQGSGLGGVGFFAGSRLEL